MADTKYKLLDANGNVPSADAYQLVTYCGRLGLSVGHLIYAAGEPKPEAFDILGTAVALVVHAVNLAQPLAGIEAEVDAPDVTSCDPSFAAGWIVSRLIQAYLATDWRTPPSQ